MKDEELVLGDSDENELSRLQDSLNDLTESLAQSEEKAADCETEISNIKAELTSAKSITVDEVLFVQNKIDEARGVSRQWKLL